MANEHIYTVKSGDTLGHIALRFYGTYEDTLLDVLVDLNNLPSKHDIKKDQKLKLPFFIQYGSNREPQYVDQNYLYEIKQNRQVVPIEFHHTELEGDPVAARRFIYCWKFELPERFSGTQFEEQVLSKLDSQSDKDQVMGFYRVDTSSPMTNSIPYSLIRSKVKSDSDRDKLVKLLKKAGYPVWKNKGILMTDDWGQPWRIEEYIEKCKKAGRFRYVASNYHEEVSQSDDYDYAYLDFERDEQDNKGFKLLYNFTDIFSQQTYFAFYTPKEIAELHFVEAYGSKSPENIEDDYFELRGRLDTREYFKTGDRYIFSFAPLDVLWARDEYVNQEVFSEGRTPEVGDVSEDNPFDYAKKVLEATNYRYLTDHPPTYYTTGDWDPEKLVDKGVAAEVVIPDVSSGTYSSKAIRIDLEPTVYEYISLLQRAAYDFEKGLQLHSKSTADFQKLEHALGEIDNLTHLMSFYPNEDDLDDDYNSKIQNYKDKVADCIDEVKNLKLDSNSYNVTTDVDHWRTAIPDKGKEAMDLIKEQKPIEYIELNEKLANIEKILDSNEFNAKLKKYLQRLEISNQKVEIDYFSFRHPCFTPIEVIVKVFVLASSFPDENRGNEFYEKYVQPFEALILKSYGDEDQKEFHDEVTKEVFRQLLDFDLDGHKIFEEAAEGEEPYLDAVEIMQDFIEDRDDFMEGLTPPQGEHIANTIWSFANNYLSWNNQGGGTSPGSLIVKAFTYYRTLQFVNGTKAISRAISAREYKLTMTLMAKTYNILKKGLAPTALPKTKKGIVRLYTEIIAKDYYKNHLSRSAPFRENMRNLQRQVERDGKAIREKLSKRVGEAGTAPKWVSAGFSGIQVATSLLGIIEVLGKGGDLEFRDCVKLVSCTASGGLALTGLPYRHVYKLFQKFPRFTRALRLRQFSRVLVKHAPTLTVVSFVTGAIESGADAAWNHKTGDYLLMAMNITRAVLFGAGAVCWAAKTALALGAVKGGLAAACTTLAGLTGPIGIIILIVAILFFIIERIIHACKTGTQKTIYMFVNDVFKPAVKKVEKGICFKDQTELFNLSPMWRINDSNQIETFPCVSPYTDVISGLGMGPTIINYKKRVLSREVKYSGLTISKKDGVYKVNDLTFEPLNYRYAVPSLVFRGWKLDMISSLHETGWIESHEKSDDEVMKDIAKFFNYWKGRIDSAYKGHNEEAKNEIMLMKSVLEKGASLDESYFNQILSGIIDS